MFINPRVPFLFLLTGSFMSLWSQDVQPSAETVIADALAQRRFEAITAVDENPDTDASMPVLTEPVETEIRLTGSDLDLPDYVAPGTYRAANHEGDVSIVRVEETEDNHDLTARDFYTHETGTDRWYLIRLDRDAVAALPDVSSAMQ